MADSRKSAAETLIALRGAEEKVLDLLKTAGDSLHILASQTIPNQAQEPSLKQPISQSRLRFMELMEKFITDLSEIRKTLKDLVRDGIGPDLPVVNTTEVSLIQADVELQKTTIIHDMLETALIDINKN